MRPGSSQAARWSLATLALALAMVTAGAAASPPPSPRPAPMCPGPAPGFSCLMQRRITAVQKYLAGSPGSIGVVLDDRATRAIWRNVNAATEYPAASTMKLAMITDLLLRNQAAAGHIHLTATDRKEMYQALYTSNDIDANDLWDRYENGSFLQRIRAFGMTRAEFTGSPPNWGFMYCTAETSTTSSTTCSASPRPASATTSSTASGTSARSTSNGVSGARPENRPGNKDGWEHPPAGGSYWWITNSVGFAVPGPEYTLAMMYNLYNYGGTARPGSTTAPTS